MEKQVSFQDKIRVLNLIYEGGNPNPSEDQVCLYLQYETDLALRGKPETINEAKRRVQKKICLYQRTGMKNRQEKIEKVFGNKDKKDYSRISTITQNLQNDLSCRYKHTNFENDFVLTESFKNVLTKTLECHMQHYCEHLFFLDNSVFIEYEKVFSAFLNGEENSKYTRLFFSLSDCYNSSKSRVKISSLLSSCSLIVNLEYGNWDNYSELIRFLCYAECLGLNTGYKIKKTKSLYLEAWHEVRKRYQLTTKKERVLSNCNELINYKNFHKLGVVLKSNKVPTEEWGRRSAKTLNHLRKEILENETVLVVKEKLYRLTSYMDINITCEVEGKKYVLKEDRQEFKDGRIRKRTDIVGSLGEKLKSNEKPNEDSVRRAIKEELGFWVYSDEIDFVRFFESEKESPSYPGLMAIFTVHVVSVKIPSEKFKPEGYIEKQSDKTTYFVWHKF